VRVRFAWLARRYQVYGVDLLRLAYEHSTGYHWCAWVDEPPQEPAAWLIRLSRPGSEAERVEGAAEMDGMPYLFSAPLPRTAVGIGRPALSSVSPVHCAL
jgi:hypothetical protein